MNNSQPAENPVKEAEASNSIPDGTTDTVVVIVPPEFFGDEVLFKTFTAHTQNACSKEKAELAQPLFAKEADSKAQTPNADKAPILTGKDFESVVSQLSKLERDKSSVSHWKILQQKDYPSFLKKQISLVRASGCNYPPLYKHTEYEAREFCGICSEPLSSEDAVQDTVHTCDSCGSPYCVNCIEKTFTAALEDVTRMPAGCCVLFPTYVAVPALTEEQLNQYRSAFEEFVAAEKSYCPVPICSAFLPSRLFPKDAAPDKKGKRVDTPTEFGSDAPEHPHIPCPKCNVEICTACKQLAHAGEECAPPAGLDKKTERALRRWGYKRCPKCGHGVKRMFGCSHMQCRCGAHWCWCCCKPFDECSNGGDGESEYDEDESDSEDEGEGPRTAEEAGQENMQAEVAENGDAVTVNAAAVGPDALATADAAEGDQNPVETPAEATVDVTMEEAPADLPINPPADNTPADNAPGTTEAPSTAQQETNATQAAAPAAAAAQRRERENLDGGGNGVWEASGLDFGDEPDDSRQDWSWRCTHNCLKALKKSAPGAECLLCWRPVVAEDDVRDRLKAIEVMMARLDARVLADREGRPYEGDRLGWSCLGCGMVVCEACRSD